MCVVSMVIDYGQRQWNFIPYSPAIEPPLDLETIKKWSELLQKGKEFDTISNQPNCEDPKKVEFVKSLVERMNTMGIEFIQLAKEIEEVFK